MHMKCMKKIAYLYLYAVCCCFDCVCVCAIPHFACFCFVFLSVSRIFEPFFQRHRNRAFMIMVVLVSFSARFCCCCNLHISPRPCPSSRLHFGALLHALSFSRPPFIRCLAANFAVVTSVSSLCADQHWTRLHETGTSITFSCFPRLSPNFGHYTYATYVFLFLLFFFISLNAYTYSVRCVNGRWNERILSLDRRLYEYYMWNMLRFIVAGAMLLLLR